MTEAWVSQANDILDDPTPVLADLTSGATTHENAVNPHHQWDRLGQLLLLSALAASGTLGNIFAIAAIMTEEQLKNKGKIKN